MSILLQKCILLTVFLGFVFLTIIAPACQKESAAKLNNDTLEINSKVDTGQLEIAVRAPIYNNKKPASCVINIKDKRGITVFNQLDLSFSDTTSELCVANIVHLPSGYYYLTTCNVTDVEKKVLYQSLQSIQFKIEKTRLTHIEPALNAVNDLKPDSFFVVAYRYSSLVKQYQPTNATITLSTNGSTFYSGTLGVAVNAIKLPDGINYFILNIPKAVGEPYRDSIPESDFNLFKRVYPYKAFLD